MPRSSDPGDVRVLEIETSVGTARAHGHWPAGRPRGALVLGHGAGGGIGAPDLVAVTRAAVLAGWRVELVEQPWRVLGRRVAAPPPRLDVAWLAVLAALAGSSEQAQSSERAGLLVVGGRSAGARVACRTATVTGADAVLCLAFPLHPPGRPDRSRAQELAAPAVPVLVVQGRRDPFGGPGEVAAAVAGLPDGAREGPAQRQVVAVEGDHGLSRSAADVAASVVGWLDRLERIARSAE